jgi:iron(III) transport system ATP-binding protein
MVPVRAESLSRSFGRTAAVDDVSFEAPGGKLTFLLGPSGCGKTTVLRMVAGLLEPSGGTVRFGDRDVTGLPAERRGCGMVFQGYALWPHMTVEENVAFGLESRRLARDEVRRRTAEALEAVRMSPYAARRPAELSGGQQQRVALARAIVYRPEVLLLDEPLSNLDARLRAEMRREIRRVVDETRITAIYVTHDQQECLSMADRVVLMRDGRIAQVGGPRELYERPRDRFVAEFLGETNLLPATVDGPPGAGPRPVRTACGVLETTHGAARPAGDRTVASVRPECLALHPAHAVPMDRPALRGTVAETTYLGAFAQHRVDCSGTVVTVLEPRPRHGTRAGESVALTAEPGDVVLLDA